MRNVIHYNEVNEVMNCSKSLTENISSGMGATMYCGTDRYAMVVVEVLSPKKIKVAYVDDYLNDFKFPFILAVTSLADCFVRRASTLDG